MVQVSDIKGTTHPSYYGLNWLQMLMSLERHKEDIDEKAYGKSSITPSALNPSNSAGSGTSTSSTAAETTEYARQKQKLAIDLE